MKRILRSPVMTMMLFLLALILLLFGSVGGTRAALNRYSDIYESQMTTTSLAIAVREGNETVGPTGLMKLSSGDMVKRAGDATLKIGKNYNLPLSVYNNGNTQEYVRVTVYKYWVRPSGSAEKTGWFSGSGTKDTTLDTSLIKLNFTSGWTEDAAARTDERTVYYYSSPVAPGDPVRFLDSVAVDGRILKETKEVNGKTVYTYDGIGFVLEVQADAVQAHNGDKARISAWGQVK